MLGLAIVQLLDVAYSLPVVPNHWLLTGIVSLAILGAAASVALRGGRRAVSLGALYQTLTPPVRISAVIFYFFACFHKLNADFLDPDVSCAVRFLEQTFAPFASLGLTALPGVGTSVILATLAAELGVAVGLAVPRWRYAACLLGAGFHLLLALDAPRVFYNFSAVMFAVLWVCLPARDARRVAGHRALRALPFFRGYSCIVGLAWGFPAEAARVTAFGFSGLWLAFALTFLSHAGLLGRGHVLHFARVARRARPLPSPPAPPRRCSPRAAGVLLLLPALLLLNGLSPYLGLKTRTAWQMYSNLTLDAATSNHLLVPYSLDLGGYLADSVRILATSDPALQARYVHTGSRMTWFELQRYVGQHPVKELTYVRPAPAAGPRATAPEDTPRKTLGQAVLEKLLIFRPVGGDGGAVCDW